MEVDERRPRSTGDLHSVCEEKPDIPITSVSLPASPNSLAPAIPRIPDQPPPVIGKRKLVSPTPQEIPQDKCLPQQFCLKWNNYQTNLTNVFDDLLQNESFVDVTLACDGQSIKAHKMVLSACSPYFQALFYENPCQHPIVIMRDVKWPELKAVIEFMYKGEINIDREKIAPLLRVAEMLQIRGLAEVGGEVEAAQSATTSMTKQQQKQPHSTDGLENLSKKMRISVSVGGGGRRQMRRTRENSHSPSIENVQAEILTTTPLLPLHSHYDDDDDEEEDEVMRLKEKQVEQQQQPQHLSKISVRNLNPSPITGGPLSSPSKSASLKPPQPAVSTPSTPNTMAQQPAGVTTTPFNLAVTPPEVINLGMSGNTGRGEVSGGGSSGEDFMRGGRGMSHVDDMEIKPEIAEMIREEERVSFSFYVYPNFFFSV